MTITIKAQKYKEGFLEYGVVSSGFKDKDIDPRVKGMFDLLGGNIECKIYFSEDKVVLVGEDYVIHYYRDTGKMYTKNQYLTKNTYTIGTYERVLQNDSVIQSIPLGSQLFGLECTSHIVAPKNNSVDSVVTTYDIDIPDFLGVNPIDENNGFVVRSFLRSSIPKFNTTYGIISFSPTIEDRSIFDIDTVGWTGRTKEGLNYSLLKQLSDDGMLEVPKDVLDEKFGYDIPTILRFENVFATMSSADLNRSLMKYNLLTPTFQKLTSDDGIWEDIPDELRQEALEIAATKDHLDRPETKSRIIENLIKGKLLKPVNIDSSSLKSIFNSISNLHLLRGGVAKNDRELLDYIKDFFKVGLPERVPRDYRSDKEYVYFRDGKNQYQLKISYYKPYDQENYYPITIDKSFYESLANCLIQIYVDRGEDKYCSIYHSKLLSMHDEYYEVIKVYPELTIPTSLYLNTFHPEADVYEGLLGTTFPTVSSYYHFLREESLVGIHKPLARDYLSSDDKIKLFAFLTKHQESLGIDSTFFENGSIYEEQYFYNSLQLLYPNLNRTNAVVSVFSGMGINPKYIFESNITPDNTDFESVFPDLFEKFGTFEAVDFQYNEEDKELSFYHKGKRHTIESSESAMLLFIQESLKQSNSEKQLYFIGNSMGLSDVYLYLTEEQKRELDELEKLGE